MKIYAVTLSDYDLFQIEGIFTTEEEAKKFEQFMNKIDKSEKLNRGIEYYDLHNTFDQNYWEQYYGKKAK